MMQECNTKTQPSLLKMYSCLTKTKGVNDADNPKCLEQDLKEAVRTTPKLMVIHTDPTCPNCSPFMNLINEMFGTSESIVFAELSSRHESCHELSKKLNLIGTPTIVFFKNGVESGRYAPIGKTEAQVKADLLKLVS